MTPFWKEEIYGYNIYQNEQKQFFGPVPLYPELVRITGLSLTPIPCVALLCTPIRIPYNGLFYTSFPCAVLFTYSYTFRWSLSYSYTLFYLLSTHIPYNGLFLTPLPCAGLFTYSSTFQWSLSYSYTPCVAILSTSIPLVSSHSSTLCWYLYLLTLVYFLLFYTLCWSFYLLLYLTLDSFTPLYLVLVILPTPIPYTGLFHTPLLCPGLFTYSYTLHWSILHSSTWC